MSDQPTETETETTTTTEAPDGTTVETTETPASEGADSGD